MALQLRRGSNAQRLGMTPANGELIYVTDADMTTVTVSAINTSTNFLTLSSGAVAADQQIKFLDDTQNGLIKNQVYFALAVGNTSVPFQVSLTSGGAAVDITGSLSAPIQFAETPTTAAGVPVGTSVARLWIGDGATVGGTIASAINLDDLLDVQIAGTGGVAIANYQHLQYDSADQLWRNVSDVVVPGDLSVNGGNINLNGTATTGVQPFLTFATQASGVNSLYGIRGKSTTNDDWLIGAGSAGVDQGFLEIATADNAGVPGQGGQIYVRQYAGPGAAPWYGGAGVLVNTLTLLDDVGDTSIPNDVTISGSTQSTTTTTGALVVTGGVGIGSNLSVGGAIYGNNTDNATTAFTGSIQTLGGIGVAKDIFVGGNTTLGNASGDTVTINASTVAIPNNLSFDSGLLKLDATNNRVGINNATPAHALDVIGAGKFSGVISTDDSLNASSGTSASIQTDGGVGMVKDLFVGGLGTITGDLDVNGGNININGTATTATMPFLTFSTQADGANPLYGIRGMSSLDDPWFVGSGSTGDDLGFLEIATGDNSGGTNNGGQIYVRQYSGSGAGGAPWYGGSGTVQNELILLDNVGNTWIPKILTVSGTTDATSQSTGSIVTAGGVGIAKKLHVGSNISVDSTTNATSGTTGSIQTDGGVGIALDLFVAGSTTITGDLTVNGTTTTINTQTLLVEDKNIEIGVVVTPTDVTASGGGITLLGATNKTITWNNATDGWELNQPLKVTGNIVTSGDIAVNGGDVTTTSTTGTLFNTTATTVNIAGAGTTVSIGANTGTTTINNDLVADALTVAGDLAVNGGDITTTALTASIFNTTATTVNAFGAATAVTIGVSGAGEVDIRPTTQSTSQTTGALQVAGGVGIVKDIFVGGAGTITTDLAINGGDITTTAATATVFNTTATTVNIGGAATTVGIGAATGTTTIANSLQVNGNTTLGSDNTDTVTINGLVTDNITFSFNDTATPRGILGQMSTGATDYWFVGGAESGGILNDGELLLATGDDGNDPIQVRQYTGNPLVSTTYRQLTLMDANGHTVLPGDLTVTGNDIKSSSATAITLSGADVAVAGDLTVTGNDIKSSSATAITLSGADVAVAGDLTVTGNDIKSSSATAITLSGADVAVVGTLDVQGGTVTDSTGALSITTGASNGAITLDPNGTGNVVCTFSNGGNITNDRNYITGAIRNATTRDTNGDIWELNTSIAQSATNPYYRGVSIDNSADTTRGPLTLMRSYSGGAGAGSGSRGRLVFEKARGTAASPVAVASGDLLGSIDATGYSSTGWINDTVGAVPGFYGFSAAENWVSNTALGTSFNLNLAATGTTITSGANLTTVLNLSPQTAAYRSDTQTFSQGKTGSMQYLDLSTTRANFGVPVQVPAFLATAVNNTLATTGASGTGSVATLTFGALASAPYTVGSSITVAGVTPAGYNGTYSVTACTTTTVSYASTTTGAQTVAGTIKLQAGTVGQQIAISDSAGGGNPNGMIAFWDTTNSRWSYIHDNSAV